MMKDYNWPGKDRRYPDYSNPCKYTLDRIRDEVVLFSKSLNNNSVVLDFGCGEKPYYPFFKDIASEYIGIDILESPEKNSGINFVIAQGDKIPFPDEYFDAILSTQVFEHIEDLHLYAREFARILKPGGKVFISAAFAWDYHPYPKDFWRITEDGYRTLFNGFSEIKFSYDTNTLQTILQSLNLLMARKKIKINLIFRIINKIIESIDYKKGINKLPGNMFVIMKR